MTTYNITYDTSRDGVHWASGGYSGRIEAETKDAALTWFRGYMTDQGYVEGTDWRPNEVNVYQPPRGGRLGPQ